MTFEPGRYARLAPLFDELAEAGAGERRKRLETLSLEDPALATELRELLDADSRAEGVLERSPTAVAREMVDSKATTVADPPPTTPPVDLTGVRLGPWRLLERIGEGGMGEVWRAERADDSFDQHVAVKLLRQGVVSEGMRRRFLVERQILARLTHPAIARLLDGGVAPDGRPYFVMELLDGLPLHEHARANNLGIEDRLRLFSTACDAIEAAHRQLVVHRDLKPSNIQVTASGELKLLDFGIAKVLEPDLFTEAEGATRMDGRAALTPEYAAPEQILGDPVTTATDVYGLGLVLYELLVGERPFRRRGSLGDLVEGLESEECERPSTAVFRLAPPTAPTERKRWGRRLRGDLDTIVLRALAPEPERRYPSAAALRDDIRRFLQGRPIRARLDGFTYRTGKFVRRHRWGTLATSLAVVLLVGGFFVALKQNAIAREHAQKSRATLGAICQSIETAAGPASTQAERDALARALELCARERGNNPQQSGPTPETRGF